MSDRGNNHADSVIPEGQKAPENIVKRFSLSKEEREKIQNIQSVMGILALEREGLNHSIGVALVGVRQRLGIGEHSAPEGFIRDITYDSNTYELVVTDIPKPKEPEKPMKPVETGQK